MPRMKRKDISGMTYIDSAPCRIPSQWSLSYVIPLMTTCYLLLLLLLSEMITPCYDDYADDFMYVFE
ncbi:hypothetical protein BDV23DRAFT_166659 [Aspergillus alliaceus]|uniref:Uncharacterized protein n=1 Tax=Petromyces alliaceus TaxID=209559 RepID=A0A5N7BSJ9_PETAA|nr:hypothetical protein BDV23DRAFT_166659 [Aspergillus alliaceus]